MSLWSRLFGDPAPPPAATDGPDDRPPARRVLYNVQHRVLPELVLMVRDARLGEVFAAGCLGSYTRYLWAKGTGRAVLDGLLPASLLSPINPTPPDDPRAVLFQTGLDLLAAVAVHAHRRDDQTVQVFVMPPPECLVECHFVAVAYRGDWPAAARYFTLERTVGSPAQRPVLCEWGADGRHLNLRHELAPDREAFAAEVLGRAA